MDKWYDKNQLLANNKPINIVITPRNRLRSVRLGSIVDLSTPPFVGITAREREFLHQVVQKILLDLTYGMTKEEAQKEVEKCIL